MDSVYVQKSNRLKELRRMVKGYTIELISLDKEMKEIDASVGQTYYGGGNYKGVISETKGKGFLNLIKTLFRNG